MDELIRLTSDELKYCNGKKGRPAFIAYNGKIYDVTENDLWGDGEHFMHQAGLDISEEISNAPHGDEKLAACILIGELIS